MSNEHDMAAIISDALAMPKVGEPALDSLRVAARLSAAGYQKAADLQGRSIAYEIRTANLIALYNMTESNCEGMSVAAPMSRANWDAVARQIKERVGLQ